MGGPQGGQQHVVNHGWRVTFAGMGINLALGVLYSWSVIKKNIPDDWEWTDKDKSWPYAIACLVFALVMVPGGRLQDKMGPRLAATIGGILVGAGMIVASLTDMPLWYILGFGLLAGSGFGFGYASATPPAVKWFPAARTGMIAGIVVSGFGLASVYIAPLTKWLIGTYGIQHAMLALGIAFLFVVVLLAQLLTPPPKGYVPAGAAPAKTGVAKKEDFAPTEMLRTSQFYLLWFMYFCGSGAGLMIIGNLDPIAKNQAGLDLGFLLVAMLAVGNGGGRILAGTLSDKFGRRQTLCAVLVIQAILMILLSFADKETTLATVPAMAVISALIGANYGANLALFPSVTKDFYGLKNFGVNYGLVFTAWGVGGFALSMLAAELKDQLNHYYYSFYAAAALLIVAAVATFILRPPHVVHHAAATDRATEKLIAGSTPAAN
jgi:OFA family oxalate/formate antiporter-like MFS transporter